MKNLSFLFADSVHFTPKNFKSLFDFITRHKIHHTFAKENNKWVACYGNYEEHFESLEHYFNILSLKNEEELLNLKINGLNLFNIARDEALTYFLPIDSFYDRIEEDHTNKKIIKLMIDVDYRALILNISAAWFWVDYWKSKLKSLKVHTYACVFSGAQIYCRSLLETLKTHPTSPLVLEHFLTGNEYYIEEKYEPIANNSNMKFNHYYRNIKVDGNDFELNRIKTKAINKFLLSKNKNVTQPTESDEINTNNREAITIIGQVANDFSIICTAKKYLCSIKFYIKLIDRLLTETDVHIIFKSHPWERHKNNLKSSLTLDKLTDYVNSLPLEQAERISLVEDYNLQQMINQSKHVLTLCSQAAIETAFMGLKPIQFGDAFYGQKGFTYDYEDIADFINDFNEGKLFSYLSIKEYDAFEVFLIKYLEKNLVSIHKSGILSLEKKLTPTAFIPLVKPKPIVSTAQIEDTHENKILTNNSIERALESVAPLPLQTKGIEIIKSNVLVVEHSRPNNGIIKKTKKLFKNPSAFLNDSRKKSLTTLGQFIFKNK